jgi:hypothetical protein
MNKHGHPSAHQHRRKMAKQARRSHRNGVNARRAERLQQQRTERFRAEGLKQISEATRALLAGAKAVGIDMTPADIHGAINTKGEGVLSVSDRVSKPDVKRAKDAAMAMTPVITGTGVEQVAVEGTRTWAAKFHGEWLKTANGSQRLWATREAAEKALKAAQA